MGVCVLLYADGPITDDEFAAAETFLIRRLGVDFDDVDDTYDGFGFLWRYDDGHVLERRPDGGVELRTLVRYYGPGYERGDWPEIYSAIVAFRRSFPGRILHYGGDGNVEAPILDDTAIAALWSHWLTTDNARERSGGSIHGDVRQALKILGLDDHDMDSRELGATLLATVEARRLEAINWGEAIAYLAHPSGRAGNTWTRTFAGKILDGAPLDEAIAEAGVQSRIALGEGWMGPMPPWMAYEYTLQRGTGNVIGWGQTIDEAATMAHGKTPSAITRLSAKINAEEEWADRMAADLGVPSGALLDAIVELDDARAAADAKTTEGGTGG